MLNFLKFPALRACGLLLAALLLGGLYSTGQTVTLQVTRQPLAQVFLQIEQQTKFRFLYSEEVLARSKPVTLSLKNVPLEEALRECFREQPLQYHFDKTQIVVQAKAVTAVAAPPPALPITGRVVNETGEGMAGITVTIIASGMTTVTDAAGNFSFPDGPARAKLSISGAETETQMFDVVAGRSITITAFAKINLLDESFVIAYGRSTKRSSTGTVTSVKKKDIDKQPVSNILSVLSGRVAGLQVTQLSGAPGTGINVQLRGVSSIASGTDPLVVVDGIPYPSQSLSGIIGGGAGTASSSLNNLNPSDIESIEVLKDADATAIYGSRGANGVILITTVKGRAGGLSVAANFYNGWGRSAARLPLLSTPDYIAMRKEAFANDGVTMTSANAADLLLWDTARHTDWQKVLFGETMQSTDAKLNLSGGSAATQFLFGTGYHRETTVFPGNFHEQRITSNFSLNHASGDKRFQFGLSASYSHYKNVLPQQDLSGFITLAPNAPSLRNADGTLNWENGTWTNPLSRTEVKFNTTTGNLLANGSLWYKVFPSFTLRLTGGYNRLDNADQITTPRTSFNPSSAPVLSLQVGSKTMHTMIAEPQAEYVFQNKLMKLTALIGSTVQGSQQNFLYQRGTGYTSDALLKSLRGASTITILSEGDIAYRYLGVFARVQYDLRNKYLFSATARRDGSSRYGTENRYSSFGSLGAAWIFSAEPFLKSNFVSYGKLKFTAGVTGNDQVGDYKYLDLYTTYTYPYLGTAALYPEQLYNPIFGWERVRKLEGSLDLGFMKNRLLATVNFYHHRTSNQLVNYPLPGATGFSSILQNIPAVIRNTGWEAEVNAKVITQKKFQWEISFNVTVPRNELVSFKNLESSSYATRYVIGEPVTIVKKYHWLGLDAATGNHRFQDFNNDNVINTGGDQQQIVFTGQKYFGGMQQEFRYGRWQFSFLLQFARVPSAANYLYIFSRPGLLQNQPSWVLDRWRKPGDGTDVQRYSVSNAASTTAFSNYRNSDAAYSDASFIRLKNVALSYTVTPERKSVVSKGEIFLKGNNLLTISGYDGLDPETLSYLTPPVRLLALGFQFTFK